jgi:hypothetical protein
VRFLVRRFIWYMLNAQLWLIITTAQCEARAMQWRSASKNKPFVAAQCISTIPLKAVHLNSPHTTQPACDRLQVSQANI